MTDFSSNEGSREYLARAAHVLTGRPPVLIDARHFYDGGAGRIHSDGATPVLHVETEGIDVAPDTLVIYEIPPEDRPRFARFQQAIEHSGIARLGTDATAWSVASDKHRMVEVFRAEGIRQMESVVLHSPSDLAAREAFAGLGGDVWARPAVGLGGRDVFHLTDNEQLARAVARYAASDQKFLFSRDARNFDAQGRRHQYRVVVLGERVLRVCEHIQPHQDLPCNEAQGAQSHLLEPSALPATLADLAITATKALGLPFGGVDLVAENGGVVFEVNVHPVLTGDLGLETIAMPFVRAHLTSSPTAFTQQATA
ncbi:ATP-grasp domain-containing protein [Nocardia callitridis]|uniref:ATP-grasp domain-containing protein n=1 Tax=Nocardia callitridis TaxID=648753 RepID=A0ABP9KY29_9NOCA